MAMKIKPTRGTKSRIETVKDELVDYQIVYATDTKELGVKNTDGTVSYMANETAKQDKLVSGVNIKTVGNQSLLGSGNISIPSTEEFASKNELSAYISSKNLAVPNLKGKEHLGDGVYKLHTQNGGTLTYNVFSGEYRIYGNLTGDVFYNFGYDRPSADNAYIQFWKTKQVVWQNNGLINLFGGSGAGIDITKNNDYAGLIPAYNTSFNIYCYQILGEIDVYFKMQLEKGDTATPYAVPSGVIPYLPEVKSVFDTKLDKVLTTSDTISVYVKLQDGSQSMAEINTAATAFSIPFRDGNGRFNVANAETIYQPVPLGQADDRYALKEDLNWTLIATNSSDVAADISIPSGYRELYIVSTNYTPVLLSIPLINAPDRAVQSLSAFVNLSNERVLNPIASWYMSNPTTLRKQWIGGYGMTTTYYIYGR